ncbi:MAG: DUF6359 domain-containing protein [Dysgonamonadaceae bacterium]|jgi:hypothetical protein|nr:DUF6359 domain-containing protein [Dysgonamonadaceae bacterium]
MKTLRKSILFLFTIFFIFTACEREFDTPPVEAPKYDGEANMTIQALKDKYTALLNGQTLIAITDDIIIKGLVVANDISGNIYKQIQLQDSTAGICIAIDQSDIYGDIRVGQELFVELKGLFFGLYGGYPQIGYQYLDDGKYTIGQMTWELFKEKAHLNGYPAPDKVIPKKFNRIDEISASDIGTLITVYNVRFEKGGEEPFAVPGANNKVQTESKVLLSATSSATLTVRNSSASNFSSRIMPAGTGSVTGILSVYNNTNQITFRDSLDCSPTRFGVVQEDGSKELPWSVPYVLENQTGNTSGWIEGYIVGSVKPGITEANPVKGNDGISFEAPFMNNTVVLAESADIKDYQKVVIVNLPENSEIRTNVNLADQADNLGKKLKVTGKLEKQFGIAGLIVDKGTGSEFEFGTQGGQNDGSENAPYSVAEVKGKQGTKDNTNFLWAKGYVVGIWEGKDANGNDLYPNNFAKFEPPFYSNVNLLLADNPSETSVENVVCVQVSTNMRDVLSPMNNPDILKKQIKVKGSFETYNNMPGIKNLQEYKYEGGGTDPNPGTGSGSSSGDPYSVTQGIANQGTSTQSWTKGYIVGAVNNGVTAITGAGDYKIGVTSGWDSATNVIIADSPSETNIDKCIITNLPAGKPLRTQVNLVDNPDNYGKTLIVKGVLRTYFGKAGLRDSAGETADFILQ